MKHAEITEKIIQSFYKVYNTLGYGFLEKVYENALYLELISLGLKVDRQRKITVFYDGQFIGEYYADLMVENLVICELKANELLNSDNEKQLINYLKATNTEVGLLLNFGEIPEFKRKVYDNERKRWRTARNIQS